jgi:hypothetical protein
VAGSQNSQLSVGFDQRDWCNHMVNGNVKKGSELDPQSGNNCVGERVVREGSLTR